MLARQPLVSIRGVQVIADLIVICCFDSDSAVFIKVVSVARFAPRFCNRHSAGIGTVSKGLGMISSGEQEVKAVR